MASVTIIPANSTVELVLKPVDVTGLIREKSKQFLAGTREWIFNGVEAWLADKTTDKVFWLMGGGGTGKTVVSAELLERFKGRVVAFHFCRHDNPAASEPGPLVRSLAAMLCKNVPGYAAAVQQQDKEALEIAMASNLISELFPVLLLQPLQALGEPAGGERKLIVIDALDELPGAYLKAVLRLLTDSFSQLPSWLCVFTTSREETTIKKALNKKYKPCELRVDEKHNQQAHLKSENYE